MNLLKTHLTKVIIVLLLTLFITSGIIGISYYKFISDTRKYNENINLNNIYYEYINKRDNLPTIRIYKTDEIKTFYDYLYRDSDETNRLERKYLKMTQLLSNKGGDFANCG